MPLDKSILQQLKQFATLFDEARRRPSGVNEADTVQYLTEFLKDVLGYSTMKGEISREYAIKNKFCDLGLKIDEQLRLLIEAKSASVPKPTYDHIDQAERYAANSGLPWVLLTNGIFWILYHLTFREREGIRAEVVFEANLLKEVEADPEGLWEKLSLLSRQSMLKNQLDAYWEQKRALNPAALVRAVLSEDVIRAIRRELHRNGACRLKPRNVFREVLAVLKGEAIEAAGEFGMPAFTGRKRQVVRTDAVTGQSVVEDDDDLDDDEPNAPGAGVKPSASGPVSAPAQQPQAANLIRFACPKCRLGLQITREFAGRQVRCTKCGQVMVVPR